LKLSLATLKLSNIKHAAMSYYLNLKVYRDCHRLTNDQMCLLAIVRTLTVTIQSRFEWSEVLLTRTTVRQFNKH